MTVEVFHYPPDVFELLIETIPRLFRGKRGTIQFFQGAGVMQEDLTEVNNDLQKDPASISKFEIVRKVLTRLNQHGDSGLRPRREIIKRVTEFESFETCWPEDQLKARGLVAKLREIVNVKDSFTRMKQERNNERQETLNSQRSNQAALVERNNRIENLNKRLSHLFTMDDKPHERGKLLESVLNDLFKVYDIHVYEDFRRKDPDTNLVLEQIDGVIELDGCLHLVEMKWLQEPVGMQEFSQHLVRLFSRVNVQGFFISSNGYTAPVINECRNVLSQKIIFLCSLRELVMLLHRQGDLVSFLKKKSQVATIEKNPFYEILT